MGMMFIIRKRRQTNGSNLPFWVLGAISGALLLLGLGIWIL